MGDGPGSIDPLKEVDAAERRIQIGTSTLAAESVLHDGGDWESKHRQRAREQAARTRDGLAAGPARRARPSRWTPMRKVSPRPCRVRQAPVTVAP